MTVLGDPIFSHYRQCLSRNYMTRMVLELFIQPEDIDSNSRLDLRVCSLVLVSTFAISLTFGMIFAPLGVVGAVAVFAHSYYSQVHLARTFRELRSRNDELTIAYEQIVDKDCEVFVESLAESLRVLPMLAALFYACFIVDILGDAEGVGAPSTIAATALMLCVPVLIWVGETVYDKGVRDRSQRAVAPLQPIQGTLPILDIIIIIIIPTPSYQEITKNFPGMPFFTSGNMLFVHVCL